MLKLSEAVFIRIAHTNKNIFKNCKQFNIYLILPIKIFFKLFYILFGGLNYLYIVPRF